MHDKDDFVDAIRALGHHEILQHVDEVVKTNHTRTEKNRFLEGEIATSYRAWRLVDSAQEI